MTITEIPLSKLEHSSVNVRKTGGQSIDDLAASIEAHGLIQTITVRAADKGKDKFEVVAGGRRLSALNRLLKEKRSANGEIVTKTFAVPCRILTDEDATEISLAENAIRQAMHPADQFEAFRALADGGMSEADIGARFSVSEKTVKQRLKLARVSPKLLAAYREGEMTLAQLEAFTVIDDAKQQEKVWKSIAKSYNSHPSSIRRELTGSKVSATSQKVTLIGLDAYLAAGGTVTTDLFAERDSTYLDDPELVDRLFGERLEAETEIARAEGWGWVRVYPERFWPGSEGLRQVNAPQRPITAEEEAALASLNAKREEVHDRYAEGGEFSDEDDAEDTRLIDEIEGIKQIDRTDWTGFDKASAGAAVSFDWNGRLTVMRGLVPVDESRTVDDMALPAAKQPAKRKAEFSATLLADLSAQRTMAMRAEMARGNTAVALDVLIWTLSHREFFHGTSDQWCAKISLTKHFTGVQNVEHGAAAEIMTERRGFWALRLPQNAADLWQWVRNADEATKHLLLAYLIATSLDATQMNGAPATANSHAIHEALGLDMADYFGPFRGDYLARVNRTQVLEAIEEAVSPEAARALNGMKKAELVAGAEAKLKGTGWIPKPLRLPEGANGNTSEQAEAA